MDKERYFIEKMAQEPFAKKVIGDDGAVLGSQVYLQDALLEDIHFKRKWMSLRQIAAKSLLVNISDAISMNAKPKYVLITAAIPKSYRARDLEELALGFTETAKAYGIQIIGGDTVSNIKLDISVTLIAESNQPIFRTGLKKGDWIAHTGKLGTSLRDLRYVLRGGKLNASSRLIEPKLRGDFFYQAAPHIRVAMDISDGLFSEMGQIARLNHLGYTLNCPIPKNVGCSGEEYELLIGFSPRHSQKILSIAKQTRTPLNIIGKSVRGAYRQPCRSHHF